MGAYVHGNVVRKQVATAPEQVREKREVSQRVRTNRSKALHMSKGYVMFLAAAAVMALFACVQYLQLQSEITSRSKNLTAMQHELADLKEANTTKYNAIMNSMNLEEIRDYAMTHLGMVYATEDQIIRYQNPEGDTTVQYSKIPENGIAVSSEIAK